jgi:aspartyl-tRNA(Asn)/glutamyl-tRNA(Gln) amidotransferase subunit B
LRSKNSGQKYRYIPETNINNIDISNLIEEINLSSFQTPEFVKDNLQKIGVNDNFIDVLLNNYQIYKIFMLVFNRTNNVQLTATWVMQELINLVNNHKLNFEDLDG